MITIFNRASVYIGRDMKEFARVRQTLAQEQIGYTYKVKNQMGQWTGSGTLRCRTGSLGQDSSLQYEYEVFVRSKDRDKAMYLLRKN